MNVLFANRRFRWASVILVVTLAGCSTKPPESPKADDEGPVRAKFAELQAALKNRDADKLWAMLDGKSRADAERVAKEVKDVYAKASANEKAKREETLGLSSAEVTGLTGVGILKTKRFQEKYHELPESKIEKVVVQGENATVHYLEPDGDHEKLILARHNGQWKAWLAMSKLAQP